MPRLQEIEIEKIDPNPYQPRKDFDEERLKALAESIRTDGLLQPIIVIPAGDRYTLVAGERRLRACDRLGWRAVQAKVIDDASNSDMALHRFGVIENSQREDLTVLETIQAVKELVDKVGFSIDEVAKLFGYSTTWAALRYSVATEAPASFVKALETDQTHISWWSRLGPLIKRYPMLEEEAVSAVLSGRWASERELREFFTRTHSLGPKLVRALIVYPSIFTDRAMESMSRVSAQEQTEIAENVMAAQDDPKMPSMTEALVIEYATNLANKHQRSKQLTDLRQMLDAEEKDIQTSIAEERQKHKERVATIQAELHRLQSTQQEEIAALEAEYEKQKKALDGEQLERAREEYQRKRKTLQEQHRAALERAPELTPEQKAELQRLEKEYAERQKQLQAEAEERRRKAQEEWAKRMNEAQEKIKELQSQWRKQQYENRIRDAIDYLHEHLWKADVHAKDWDQLDMAYVIEEMPQSEFQHVRRVLSLVLSKLEEWEKQVREIDGHMQRRANQRLRSVRPAALKT